MQIFLHIVERPDLLPIFGSIVLLILFNSNNNSLPSVDAAQTKVLNETTENSNLDQPRENRSSILNQEGSTKAEPSDLSGAVEAILPPELVAEELSSLNPEEIANYPLQELSTDDIVTTFNLLSDQTLEKVLSNIRPDNLKIIFDKIPSEMHHSIIGRLNPQLKNQILNTTGVST